MTTVKITLQFDERDLGDKWLNPDNLDQLLYTSNHTNKELLRVIDYQEGEKKMPNWIGLYKDEIKIEIENRERELRKIVAELEIYNTVLRNLEKVINNLRRESESEAENSG